MNFLTKIFFSISRKSFYFFNKIYFNFFLKLKKSEKTYNKNIDFHNFYNEKFHNFKKKYNQYYHDIKEDKFKKMAIFTGIDLPAKNDGSNFNHGIILYKILDEFIKKKNNNFEIIEVGTARGYTSLCMSQAINDNNDNSKILSLDVIPNNKKFFQRTYLGNEKVSRSKILENFSNKLLENIIFLQSDTFSDLDKIVFHNLKFAFIDGEHNYKYLIKELNFCKNNMSDNGLIVVDDFNTSDFSEVVECVKKFSNENNYNLKIINYGDKSNFAVINKN